MNKRLGLAAALGSHVPTENMGGSGDEASSWRCVLVRDSPFHFVYTSDLIEILVVYYSYMYM